MTLFLLLTSLIYSANKYTIENSVPQIKIISQQQILTVEQITFSNLIRSGQYSISLTKENTIISFPVSIEKDNKCFNPLVFYRTPKTMLDWYGFLKKKKLMGKNTVTGYTQPERVEVLSIYCEQERNLVKPGDKWTVHTTNQLLNPYPSRGAIYFSTIDDYEFQKIVEYNGKKYAVIMAVQYLYTWYMFAQPPSSHQKGVIASQSFVNVGRAIFAYDFEEGIIKELLYEGSFNAYVNGAIMNPMLLLAKEESAGELAGKMKNNSDKTRNAAIIPGFGVVIGYSGVFEAGKQAHKALDYFLTLKTDYMRELTKTILFIDSSENEGDVIFNPGTVYINRNTTYPKVYSEPQRYKAYLWRK